ncbi:CPBP family intramembrane glutamic endopeptidase [Pandoraea sputorum]|uniref:CPBP family intramembrane glutamic endopeptidase n=1 Tax=Pandoraea sputorum TaxID=93222 RepID=UPI00123EE00B|nr:type II CAAX endopeptidase family protein [Pandoraea sputorum]VVE56752.1 membrane protein [Pandoraea sputorum]
MKVEPREYCFPSLLDAFFVLIALFFLELITNSIVVQLSYVVGIRPMAAYSIGRVLAYGLVFAIVLHKSKRTYRELFHEGRVSMPATLGLFSVPVVLLVPGLLLFINVIEAGVVQMFPMGGTLSNPAEAYRQAGLGAIFLVCIIAPVVEEMLFRGIILRGFLKQYPPGTAIAHSAAVFGLAHLNVYQFVAALVIGLILGKMYERTRSILPGILLHMVYNTAVVVSSICIPDGMEDASIFELPALWWLVGIACGAAGAFMLHKLIGGGRVVPDPAGLMDK